MSTSRPPVANCWPPIACRPPASATRGLRAGPADRALKRVERTRPGDAGDERAVERRVHVVDDRWHAPERTTPACAARRGLPSTASGTAALARAAPREHRRAHAGREQLDPRAHAARAVPAGEAMRRKELAAARPRQPQHVLQVGGGGRDGAQRRARERPVADRESEHADDAGGDLEAARLEVLVRHGIRQPVRNQTDEHGGASRRGHRADQRARGDVGRDDHAGAVPPLDTEASSFATGIVLMRMLPRSPTVGPADRKQGAPPMSSATRLRQAATILADRTTARATS